MTKLVKAQDPCHSGWCVDEQVADGAMSGFAANYRKTRPKPPFKGDSAGVVMAYHPAKQLPVYAYLADRFCVCDHWSCSIGGATMPNRCYAAAGTSSGAPGQPQTSALVEPGFVRAPPRRCQCAMALVLARLRPNPLDHRSALRPLRRNLAVVLRPPGPAGAPKLSAARCQRRLAGGVMDRSEFHRSQLRPRGLKRRPSTLGSTCRADARA